MYLGLIKLGDDLTFYVNTHTPATGAAVAADAAPGYRVYETETAAPLLTGSMAALDAANCTGFYSEQIAVTVGNGFEAGKSYTVRITGVVVVLASLIFTPAFLILSDVSRLASAGAMSPTER